MCLGWIAYGWSSSRLSTPPVLQRQLFIYLSSTQTSKDRRAPGSLDTLVKKRHTPSRSFWIAKGSDSKELYICHVLHQGTQLKNNCSRDSRSYIGPTTWIFSFGFVPNSKPLSLISHVTSATAMVVATCTSGMEKWVKWCHIPGPKLSINLILQLHMK